MKIISVLKLSVFFSHNKTNHFQSEKMNGSYQRRSRQLFWWITFIIILLQYYNTNELEIRVDKLEVLKYFKFSLKCFPKTTKYFNKILLHALNIFIKNRKKSACIVSDVILSSVLMAVILDDFSLFILGLSRWAFHL